MSNGAWFLRNKLVNIVFLIIHEYLEYLSFFWLEFAKMRGNLVFSFSLKRFGAILVDQGKWRLGKKHWVKFLWKKHWVNILGMFHLGSQGLETLTVLVV